MDISSNRLAVGLAIGVAIGTAMFAATDNPAYIGFGAGIGVAIGLAMGYNATAQPMTVERRNVSIILVVGILALALIIMGGLYFFR